MLWTFTKGQVSSNWRAFSHQCVCVRCVVSCVGVCCVLCGCRCVCVCVCERHYMLTNTKSTNHVILPCFGVISLWLSG